MAKSIADSLRMTIDKLEAMMPKLLAENVKQLEGLPLSEKEVERNLGLAKLYLYEEILTRAIDFMRDNLKEGGTIVPMHDVFEQLGMSKH